MTISSCISWFKRVIFYSMVLSIFEKGEKGQKAYSLPKSDKAFKNFLPPASLVRTTPLFLPEVSELTITRHFSRLAQKNMGIDTHFYPLGSCTMKFNPRIGEKVAALEGFQNTHPLAPPHLVKGNLMVEEDFLAKLCALCGMDGGTFCPNAGAQGEFVGVHLIRAYHRARGSARDEMLIPEDAHGTNPATAKMVGFRMVPLKMDQRGVLTVEVLKQHLGPKTAGLMLTNPGTLGLFHENILTISEMVHASGGLLYYDGANLNPLMGVVKPGDMGFDVMHLNLHKTFSTPHGGGGPGAGPVLCKKHLMPFLPYPQQTQASIGRVASFRGNFAVVLRAYLYFLLHGFAGLRRVAEIATLNANYVKQGMAKFFTVPYPQLCMHEFVVQADRFLDRGIKAIDIAKRLIDKGIHPPTVYFPLIVKECLLIEPTETESKETLDNLLSVMEEIVRECLEAPHKVLEAPESMPRLDEVQAARRLHLTD